MSLTQIRTESLAAEVTTAIVSAAGVPPKITSLDYPGDDTAADPAGGQTVVINGANFTASSTVYINGNQAGVVSYINATALSFTTPAGSAGVVSLYVVNADGGTAIAVPGLLYSGTPTWTTSAGTLGSPYEANSFSVTLQATGDGNVTFSVSAGNTIPAGLTLASNGLLSGTIPATDPTTTYTFYVDAIDAQNQETTRTFSVTYTKDTVTWSSPANGAAYSFNTGAANTIALEANSAAGKSITYTIQSGSLPANVSISGSDITGTPNTGQNNTSVIIRATAASTNRFADRTLYFTIIANTPYSLRYPSNNAPAPLLQEHNGTFESDTFGDIFISSDGTKFYSTQSSVIYQYALSPAYSITTLTQTRVFSAGSGVSGVFFKPDGTILYDVNYSTKKITQRPLYTAWQIGDDGYINTSGVKELSVQSVQNFPFGMHISPDGTKLFIIGNAGGNKNVHRYDLGTAWEIDTAVFNSGTTLNLPTAWNAWNLTFSSSGDKLFVSQGLVSGNNVILEYGLSTPWNPSTGTLNYTLDTGGSQSSGYRTAGQGGICFSADGSNFYMGVPASGTYLYRFNTSL